MTRLALLLLLGACSHDGGTPAIDAAAADAIETDAEVDAANNACVTSAGESGECMSTSACAAIAEHTSVAHLCPGPAEIQCCVVTPSVASNPPVPAGYKLMTQAEVTPEMTTWAVDILHDPVTYPMFATTTRMFGALLVLARVEWHPPDFQNGAIHRGVTLYEPT